MKRLLGPVLYGALALGWAGEACSNRWWQDETEGKVATKALPDAPEARDLSEAFVGVAERLAPSVVRITTRADAIPAEAEPNPFRGTPFERFFEQFGPRRRGPRMGMGSGVVIDARGHILTNEHVVSGADHVRVTFRDGKESKGKIVGTDPKTDLAVIKVDGVSVKPAQFGKAENMRVGEWVIAIGNPFGLDHSVTVGVLSAKERYGFAPGKLEDFLQTDASINPGNSGGPLVNLRGEVVGINSMIAGLGTGVGFAVSEGIARPIAQQLIEHGRVTRAYIGVVMQPLTPELRSALGDKTPEKGALVTQVEADSPAAEAGMREGDIVVAVEAEPIEDSRDVQSAVLEKKAGERIELTVWRDGKEQKTAIKTREMPGETEGEQPAQESSRQEDLGVQLMTLTPPLAERLELDPATKGVAVTAIRPDGVAAEAGLRPGDVIVGIDNGPVTTAQEAGKRLSQEREGGHLVRVLRGEGALFVVMPNPAETEED